MLPEPNVVPILEAHLFIVKQPKIPFMSFGRYRWFDPPMHAPGPSLIAKPRCHVWNIILHGTWALEDEGDIRDYGNAVHKAYFDWFVKMNKDKYDKIESEPHYVLAPLTAVPDIVYCKGNECGVIEVKSYSTDKLDKALPQLALYVYIMRRVGINVTQAYLVLRNAVLPYNIQFLYREGEQAFRTLRTWIREPPRKPYASCHKCPYALVCRIPKPTLVDNGTPNPGAVTQLALA
jgi:hypothetical protein